MWRRYGGRRPEAKRAIWCLHAPISRIAQGMALIVALPRGARVHWGVNGWQDVADGETQDTGLGLHGFELGAAALSHARVSISRFNGATRRIGWAKISMSPSKVRIKKNPAGKELPSGTITSIAAPKPYRYRPVRAPYNASVSSPDFGTSAMPSRSRPWQHNRLSVSC